MADDAASSMQAVHIMKFGGSSVGDATRLSNVADIIQQQRRGALVVVVSAMAGVTDLLIAALTAAGQGESEAVKTALREIRSRHEAAIAALPLPKLAATTLHKDIDDLLGALQQAVGSVEPGGDATKQTYDQIVAYGERLSIRLLAAVLTAKHIAAEPVEATELIVTNDRFGDAEPLLDVSAPQARARLRPLLDGDIVPVVTGFIGATADGKTTTLGRGGSDYTSTILAYCLDAGEVTIWTDVTGVMTADPRVIDDAQTISELSYEEAAELSFYGAKVLHPLTMVPVAQKNIPIYIKNTFEPAAVGTRIVSHQLHSSGVVKAITTLNGLSMITVKGAAAQGKPLYLAKIIEALLAQNIDILVLIQSSSDHNTVLMVRSYVADEAVRAITKLLVGDAADHSHAVQVEPDISVVAVVGDGIHAVPGLAGQVFSSLTVSGVEAVAIAYGSSKHNLSFAIKTADAHNAVRSLHQAFQLIPE